MSVNNTPIHTQLPPNTAGPPAKVSNSIKKTLHRPFNPVASPSTIKDSSTIKIPLNSKSVPILTGVPSSQNVGFLTATNLYPNVKNSPAKNISRTGFARLNTANTIEIVSKSQGGNTQTIFLSTAGKVRTQQVTAKIQSASKGSLVSIVSRTNNPTKTIQQSNIQNTAVVPDMKKFPNVTHQEKTTKTVIANPLNIDQNFSGKNFANPNPVVQAVVNNYNISSNKSSTNIASPSARAVNQTNPVAFGSRKPSNNQTTQMMKNLHLAQYKVLMPGKPSQIVKPQTVVNLKTDNMNSKALPQSNYQQACPTAPSTGRSGQAELRIIQNPLLPQATNTQQSPKTNVPNILRRQQTSRHVSNNDTSATNKPFGPRKEMSRPQIIQATGAKISNGGMMHTHNYPLTQSPFSTKNDQQNKINNNILRIGSAASASLHNGNQYNNGYNLYTQGGNSPHMKNKPNNNTRVTNLHGISVQQRGSLQNKQPSSKMYTGNAPGTFNHVVVSQPGQRPVGTGTVVATSGVKRDFQTMQGDAQASSAIISRCIPSSKVIEKVQRSPRKKPRKQKHTVALDAGYSDEFVVVDSREEVKPTYRKKSGEKSSLSNFNPIAQAQVGAISISNKPNQQQTYRNIQPKSDLKNEKSSVVKQQQQMQNSNKMDSFDVQMKLITNQKQAAAVQPLQQETRPAPSKNTSGEAPVRSQRPTVGSNHRYSNIEGAVRPPQCWDDTSVYLLCLK